MTTSGPDRLRELLDAVLDEPNRTLDDMAGAAHASRFHFARTVSAAAGESPAALRRRVLLERAAWQLRDGASVLDAAIAAGYDSAEGFSRAYSKAFGHPPSAHGAGHWLPSANGIHFHPPMSIWIEEQRTPANPLLEQQLLHDADDTAALIAFAATLPTDVVVRAQRPGQRVLDWAGDEPSIVAVLAGLVYAKETWLAVLDGRTAPTPVALDAPRVMADLAHRHEAVTAGWIARVREIDRGGAWQDRVIDALCVPPESFQLSGVVAHVLHYGAHRREVARGMLAEHGLERDAGDPILWLRARRGEA
ncbi:helix-turn-helix transcriptional regulator [Leucobacter aridicollis]|uniref:AraC-like DNA-binding protein n=1 Tax=Leucobacter aridicollis TaxID=283878 RepID=A0A852R9M8_9MICO|nr:helix-turn-helix transcriptional regulator [Leucobacter aridicollis]MBL3681850.1 AraC family transcriptional regulator [Leucobacter aridicollis]NYD27109.1 AraC-like DNA-binding protein [Leucobacter aridicollis]